MPLDRPGVFNASSIELWREQNRAPVFRDQVNQWIVATSTSGAATGIEKQVELAIKRNAPARTITNYRTRELSTTMPTPGTPTLMGLLSLPVDPIPDVPTPTVFALVEFAWRGIEETVPWLSERLGVLGSEFTFADPEFLLMAVNPPQGVAPEAEPESPFDLPDLPQAAGAGFALGLGVGLLGLYFLLRR